MKFCKKYKNVIKTNKETSDLVLNKTYGLRLNASQTCLFCLRVPLSLGEGQWVKKPFEGGAGMVPLKERRAKPETEQLLTRWGKS